MKSFIIYKKYYDTKQKLRCYKTKTADTYYNL